MVHVPCNLCNFVNVSPAFFFSQLCVNRTQGSISFKGVFLQVQHKVNEVI